MAASSLCRRGCGTAAPAAPPIVGVTVGLLLTARGLPGVLAGYGLLRHRPWARVLARVVGALGPVSFPAGRAIGICALLVLTREAAQPCFEVQPA